MIDCVSKATPTRRSPRARNRWFVKWLAESLGCLRNANQRSWQIAFNIHRERFDWRDVQNAASLGWRRRWCEIDAPPECGQGFAGARRREDQSRLTARDRGPVLDLRARWLGKNAFKPMTNSGVEDMEGILSRDCGRGLVVLCQSQTDKAPFLSQFGCITAVQGRCLNVPKSSWQAYATWLQVLIIA